MDYGMSEEGYLVEPLRNLWVLAVCWEGNPKGFYVFESEKDARMFRQKLVKEHGFKDWDDYRRAFENGTAGAIEYFLFKSS